MGRKQERLAKRKAAFKKVVVKERKPPEETVTYVRDPEKRPWTPFRDVTKIAVSRVLVELRLHDYKEAYRRVFGGNKGQIFQNSHYVVQKRDLFSAELGGKTYYQLSIRTVENDSRHDWREFQRIKNELCGPGYEAVEVYPAESRLVDTSNQFYLWVLPEGDRVRFGFEERLVMQGNARGARQRPFRKDQLPADLTTQEEYDARLSRLVSGKEDGDGDREGEGEGEEAESAAVRGPADPGGPESGAVPAAGAAGGGLQDAGDAGEAGQDPGPGGEAGEGPVEAGPEDRGPGRPAGDAEAAGVPGGGAGEAHGDADAPAAQNA